MLGRPLVKVGLNFPENDSSYVSVEALGGFSAFSGGLRKHS